MWEIFLGGEGRGIDNFKFFYSLFFSFISVISQNIFNIQLIN